MEREGEPRAYRERERERDLERDRDLERERERERRCDRLEAEAVEVGAGSQYRAGLHLVLRNRSSSVLMVAFALSAEEEEDEAEAEVSLTSVSSSNADALGTTTSFFLVAASMAVRISFSLTNSTLRRLALGWGHIRLWVPARAACACSTAPYATNPCDFIVLSQNVCTAPYRSNSCFASCECVQQTVMRHSTAQHNKAQSSGAQTGSRNGFTKLSTRRKLVAATFDSGTDAATQQHSNTHKRSEHHCSLTPSHATPLPSRFLLSSLSSASSAAASSAHTHTHSTPISNSQLNQRLQWEEGQGAVPLALFFLLRVMTFFLPCGTRGCELV